jgi:hypothetical protein
MSTLRFGFGQRAKGAAPQAFNTLHSAKQSCLRRNPGTVQELQQ